MLTNKEKSEFYRTNVAAIGKSDLSGDQKTKLYEYLRNIREGELYGSGFVEHPKSTPEYFKETLERLKEDEVFRFLYEKCGEELDKALKEIVELEEEIDKK